MARSESRLIDAQLQAGLRAAVAAYDERLEEAGRHASSFAGHPELQEALLVYDIARLYNLTRGASTIRIESGSNFHVGRTYAAAAERRVVVYGAEGEVKLGTIVASVPLDDELAARLRARSGLQPGQRIAILRGGRIIAAAPGLGGTISVAPGRPATVELGGSRYRALSAAPTGETRYALAILSPQSWIDAANRSAKLRLLAALLGSLVLVALVAYLEGRSIARTLRKLVEAAHAIAVGRLHERVSVRGRDEFAELGRAFNEMAEELEARMEDLESERRRLREATVRFGEALAATHDVDQLLRAIVETAVEGTRATGGLLIGRDGQIVQVGDPDGGEERFELPLRAGRTNFGTLVLCGPEFSIHDIEAASLLVGHAVVALENARLHRILERQARVDGLTGLANRRQAEDTLATEIVRAERFGNPLSVVIADLDAFKGVNDRFGHPAGDTALREFADVLRETLREVDLAARWGGEEFALILPNTDLEGAAHVAERVRSSLAGRIIVTGDGRAIRITASFGVATYPAAANAAELVAAADAALYEAKRTGKNRVAVASEPAAAESL